MIDLVTFQTGDCDHTLRVSGPDPNLTPVRFYCKKHGVVTDVMGIYDKMFCAKCILELFMSKLEPVDFYDKFTPLVERMKNV
jgi:hypothetical protein